MNKILFSFCMLMLLVATGCATKKNMSLSPEDNPANHYLQGMKLIESENWNTANIRLERALALDPEFAPAIAGCALIKAHSVTHLSGQDYRELVIDKVREQLTTAYKNAENDTERFMVIATAIRAENYAQGSDWLFKAKSWYATRSYLSKIVTRNLIYYESPVALDYEMARAYFTVGQYKEAKEMLTFVIAESTTRWHHGAGKLFAKIHKIERATVHHTVTDVSKAIATKNEVCRADVAVLLVNELKLDYLFTKRLSAEVPPKADYVPADIVNHPLKEEMLKVFSWHIRGLEPKIDTLTRAPFFYPTAAITRQELAFILEDILIKITQDELLATKFIGQANSPFPDVKPTQASYNAIMNSVTRNLLENDLTGAFRPNDKLDGAELLLAIVRLRNVIVN